MCVILFSEVLDQVFYPNWTGIERIELGKDNKPFEDSNNNKRNMCGNNQINMNQSKM